MENASEAIPYKIIELLDFNHLVIRVVANLFGQGGPMMSERARASERRLKFSSVRTLEGQNASPRTLAAVAGVEPASGRAEPAKRGASLAAIGGLFSAAYVIVARKLLIGLEAVKDGRAARRAVALRRSARADAASSIQKGGSSLSARSNSPGDDLR
jgi:hypothetical protein